MLQAGAIKHNRYRVKSNIGHGGTSQVYLVEDTHIGCVWAMKEITKAHGLARIMATREVETLRAIKHPMFPYIADCWDEEDALYIISEYVDGVPLSSILHSGSITKRRAWTFLMDIAEGLEYLHGLSPPLLYLDLKPENILLCSDGRLALVDFGIAGRLATSIIPMGTPGYAAPEQNIGNSDYIDERTDIYALGMTYYAIRTGCNPSENYHSLIEDIKHNHIFSHQEKTFIRKCIAEDRNNRFSSVRAAAACAQHIYTNTSRKRLIMNISMLLLCIIVALLIIFRIEKISNERKQAASSMISQANNYIQDGEYTLEESR